MDLESRFTEAALGPTLLADYRNFAHGRHHWLAEHGSTTGVLAFVTTEVRDVADRTLRLLPSDVPIVRVEIEGTRVRASIAALIVSMYVAGFAGKVRNIDPGRPGVPLFGRRLYHLRGLQPAPSNVTTLSASEVAAIECKAGVNISTLQRQGMLAFWQT